MAGTRTDARDVRGAGGHGAKRPGGVARRPSRLRKVIDALALSRALDEAKVGEGARALALLIGATAGDGPVPATLRERPLTGRASQDRDRLDGQRPAATVQSAAVAKGGRVSETRAASGHPGIRIAHTSDEASWWRRMPVATKPIRSCVAIG